MFTVYRKKPFTAVNNGGKKNVANTAFNGKLLLAIGNPIMKALPYILKDFHTG